MRKKKRVKKDLFAYKMTDELLSGFFEELRDASKIIVKGETDINIWPSKLLTDYNKFSPRGAVIHTSGLQSMKDTLLSNNSGLYSSHFIITSNMYKEYFPHGKYKYITDLPATIIMPFDLDQYVPHSGYLSPVTWGIEMRNLSLLRPEESKFVGILEESEINNSNIRYWKKDPLYYFWRKNSWSSPYEGPAYTWQGYHYEKFTRKQFITLYTLLRFLNSVTDVNPALVLPSSAVIGDIHNCPILPIDLMQAKYIKNKHGYKNYTYKQFIKLADINGLFHRKPIEEEADNYNDDDGVVNNVIEKNKWRSTRDNEKLSKIFKHGDVKFPYIFRDYRKALRSMGYCTVENYFTKSLQLYANARNIELEESILSNELEKDFFNMVNGSY